MKWESPEIEQFYKILNNVYVTLMTHKHPYIKKIYIDPISFNEIFLKEERWNDIKVVVCSDFLSDEYNQRNKNWELGTDITSMMSDLVKMVPNNEILGERKIYPNLKLNFAEDCEGLVRYVR